MKQRGSTRRPVGPAPRIRNPLAIRKEPRIIERVLVDGIPMRPLVAPRVNIPRGDGRTCAIVGNAQSIMDHTDGLIIDANDTVVRINNPRVTNQECQGKRCDILFVTPLSLKRLPRQKVYPYEIVDVGTRLVSVFDMWSARLQLDVGCKKARPTTGFIAIAYMIELGYSVSLFGFDWFKTPSLSAIHIAKVHDTKKTTKWQHHYPEWEEATAKDLITRAAMRTL